MFLFYCWNRSFVFEEHAFHSADFWFAKDSQNGWKIWRFLQSVHVRHERKMNQSPGTGSCGVWNANSVAVSTIRFMICQFQNVLIKKVNLLSNLASTPGFEHDSQSLAEMSMEMRRASRYHPNSGTLTLSKQHVRDWTKKGWTNDSRMQPIVNKCSISWTSSSCQKVCLKLFHCINLTLEWASEL